MYFPEHTHLPVRADTPPALVEGVANDDYRRSLDPLVALATAASVTDRILLGTGVLLIAQHDPIVLAKQLATLDHLSGGRVVLGMGFGWNREEAADHGVAFEDRRAVAREHVLCMQALWSEERAEFHGDYVTLEACWSWPKPVQQPRITTLVGGGAGPSVFGAVAEYGDGWMPVGGSGLADALPGSVAPSRTVVGIRIGFGWFPSGPYPPSRSWTTTSRRGSMKSCSGSRRAARRRCWRSSTATLSSSTRFGGDDG